MRNMERQEILALANEYHARIIARKSLARQMISFAGGIETDAFDETNDIDELMQRAESVTMFFVQIVQ